jgi:hypothetical protein
MSIATDVRAYADLALEQGKNVLSQAGAVMSTANKRLAADAPKPVFAALGVADLLAETVSKQAEMLGKRVETLPADAAENAARMQDTGKSLISRTQDDAMARITELRGRLDTGVQSAKALPTLSITAASIGTVYLSNARQALVKLAARGEARAAELRNDPRVTRVLTDLDEASTAIQARFAPVLGSVRSEVVPYLDSAVDAIKEADLGESAQPARASNGTRRGSAGDRVASSARRASSKATAAGRGAKSASGSAAKAGARKAPASRTTTAARKAPAAKAPAAKAPAAKAPAAKATSSNRKSPAKKA